MIYDIYSLLLIYTLLLLIKKIIFTLPQHFLWF